MKATCACGALRAKITGAPKRVSVCHCHACRTRTGRAFSTNMRFDRAQVTSRGRAQSYARIGDDGGTIKYHFCPTCGVSVWYENSGLPEAVMVPAGALAPADLPAPSVSVYQARCPAWLRVDTDDVI